MSAYTLLAAVFAYPVVVGFLFLVGSFAADETWYLDHHQ